MRSLRSRGIAARCEATSLIAMGTSDCRCGQNFGEAQAAELALKHQDLMAERQEFNFEVVATAKEVSDCGEEDDQDIDHRSTLAQSSCQSATYRILGRDNARLTARVGGLHHRYEWRDAA